MVDELLNVQQVADRLQSHIMSVYKLIREGKLKAIRVPRVGLRVKIEELKKLLDHKKESNAKPRRKTNAKPRE